jgi:hypothetical protein
LADGGMSHDVVLVQTWVPVPCDMVEADLDVEDKENLIRGFSVTSGADIEAYRVVLVKTFPLNS